MMGVRMFPSFMIAGAALFASMVPGTTTLYIEKHSTAVYLALAQGAIYAVFTFLLLREKDRLSAEQSRRYFLYLLGFGIVMRAMLLFAPPHSSDVYRYVWDGRVQAEGINPYRYIPADPALTRLRDADIYVNINRREFAPTIYPPAAQAVFFAASRLSESVIMMKAAMLAFEALAIWALIQLLAARGLPIVLAALYLLHPLPIWEIAGSGHIDSVAVAFLLLALLAAEKGKRFSSGATLAAGVLTKYFPLALTPAIYRRWDWRMPAALIAAAFALYLPYLSVGKKVSGFLGGYADEEFGEGNGLYILAILKQLGFGAAALPLFLGAGALALFALAWRAGFRPNPAKPDLQGAFAIAICCTVLFTPHYAWYFLWLIPFLCFFPRPSVFWLTLSAPLLYRIAWPPTVSGLSIEYVPFAVLLAVENLKFFKAKEAALGRAVA
ncbi:MAG TPA: glycosyltransferase 87 family protein [Hyphomicrobiales bacterium]|nr:glycosyltransferase 87 family protein [Hyphomicrobiales bacterium]